MIGNVNVPGALATDIASVSSVANEALNKATQALSSGAGSGNTELNMELTSTKYYPAPGFVNMVYKDGYYLVASGNYLYFTEDFITWNRSRIIDLEAFNSSYNSNTYYYQAYFNYVYIVKDMIVVCRKNTSANKPYGIPQNDTALKSTIQCVYKEDSIGENRIMYTTDNISNNMTFNVVDYNNSSSTGMISYNNGYYYYTSMSNSSSNKIRQSTNGTTWTETGNNEFTGSNYVYSSYLVNNYGNYTKCVMPYSYNSSYYLYTFSDNLSSTSSSQGFAYTYKCDTAIIDNDLYMISMNNSYNVNIKKFTGASKNTTSFDISFSLSNKIYLTTGFTINNVSLRLINWDNNYFLLMYNTYFEYKFIKIQKSNGALSDINITFPFGMFNDYYLDKYIYQQLNGEHACSSVTSSSKFTWYNHGSLLNINGSIYLIGDIRFPIMKLELNTFIPKYISKFGLSYINIKDDKMYLPLNTNIGLNSSNWTNWSYYNNTTIDSSYKTVPSLLPQTNYVEYNNSDSIVTNATHSFEYIFYHNNDKYRLLRVFVYKSTYTQNNRTDFILYKNGSQIGKYASINMFGLFYVSHIIKDDNIYICLSVDIGELNIDNVNYNAARINPNGSHNIICSQESGYNFNGTMIFQVKDNTFNLIQDTYQFVQNTSASYYKYYINTFNNYKFINDMVLYNDKIYSIGPNGCFMIDFNKTSYLPNDFMPLGIYVYNDMIITYGKNRIIYSNNNGATWNYSTIIESIPNNIIGLWCTNDTIFVMDEENTIYTFTEIE